MHGIQVTQRMLRTVMIQDMHHGEFLNGSE